MKKLVLSLIALFFITAGYSQFTKGSYLLGGNTNLGLGFTTNKTKANGSTSTDSKSSSFSIEPQAGYFIMDNLAIGTGIYLGTSTTKDDGSSAKFSYNRISLTPFGRYYFNKVYGQLGFELGSEKYKNTTGNGTTTESKNSLTGWSLGAGYVAMLNDAVALEPQIGYGSYTSKDKNDVKDINAGLYIRVGVYVYLSKLGK